jgi:hypothetical protein
MRKVPLWLQRVGLISLREIANPTLHPVATAEALANAIDLSDTDGQEERPDDSHNNSRHCFHSLPPRRRNVFLDIWGISQIRINGTCRFSTDY